MARTRRRSAWDEWRADASGRPFYRGDIAYVASGLACIVRTTEGNRVKIQLGGDWTWVFKEDLEWRGDVFESRLPRTERAWKRLGERLIEHQDRLGYP